ncbi:hypothetical protein ACIP9H_30575 [Streptomyces sp. NPDC088732]|uniref:hypothetical protein n=1 Tax=Streptomyces sp. NPDC088732 TaxID=3365879 RepID=UPI0038040C52
MRRPVRSSVSRAARALAAVAVLAAGFGAAAPAVAADGAPLPVGITGESRVDLSLQGDNGDVGEPQVTLRLSAPGDDEPGDDGVIPVAHEGEYKITIDATGLNGVAAVKLPCTATGMTAVCEGNEINAGEQYNRLGGIRLDLNGQSEAGDFGTIKVTGEGEGVAFAPLTIDVLVGGPELLGRNLSEPKGFAAGDTYNAPVGFRNAGGMAADGTVLHFHGSRGLGFPDNYGNCAYKQTTDGSLLHQGTDAMCTFDGTYKPGTAYALAEPLKVKTADFALNDVLSYGFSAVSAQQAKTLLTTGGYTPGTGAPLALKEVPGASADDYSRYTELDLPSHNIYDLVLTGVTARGVAGDTVKADIGFRNDGPAWLSALRSGGEPIGFTVQVPTGATVTKSPSGCRATTIAQGVKGYLCWVDTPLLENTRLTFPFELRINTLVENAKARIALQAWNNPSEPNQSNNAAWIVLNPGDEDTSTGGSPSAGTSATPSPSPSSSDDDASASGGTSGTGGSTSSGGGSGGLAFTGAAGVLTIGGGALLVLGVGTAVVVLVRRKSAA